MASCSPSATQTNQMAIIPNFVTVAGGFMLTVIYITWTTGFNSFTATITEEA